MFTRAIVRIPGSNFADGLTTVDLGIPHFDEVLHQHARYCDALRECGLSLTILDPDLRYPDSTFVEDAAILTPHAAIFTRPGASSREGEVAAIRPVVERYLFPHVSDRSPRYRRWRRHLRSRRPLLHRHFAPHQPGRRSPARRPSQRGRLLCLHHRHPRDDHHPASEKRHQLHRRQHPRRHGRDGRQSPVRFEFARFNLLRVPPAESYAANCVRVNDRVLVAEGFPQLHGELIARGFSPLVLNMSEFQKMDGGLSCLSLRF